MGVFSLQFYWPVFRITRQENVPLVRFDTIIACFYNLHVNFSTFEPPHDKTNKMACAHSKTQISLGIRPVWWESSLSAWRKLGSLATHWAHSEDSDKTGRMPRLIWVFAGRTCHFVGFVMRRLICSTFIPFRCFVFSKTDITVMNPLFYRYILNNPCTKHLVNNRK